MSEPEKWILDHREYKDISKKELGFEAPELNTYSYLHKTRYGQLIDTFVADGRPNGVGYTEIASTSHNYRIDGLLKLRTAMEAYVTGSRQAVANVPGVDKNWRSFQSPRQLFAGLMGNTEPTATLQLEALIAALKLQKKDELRIRGESLGVDQGVGMITSMTSGRFAEMQFQITNVNFDELIYSYGMHSLGELFTTVGSLNNYEASLIPQYLGENNEIGHGDVLPSNKEFPIADRGIKMLQAFAVGSSGAAVRKGIDVPLVRALQDSSSGVSPDTEFILSQAVNSSVSDPEDIALLAGALRKAHARVRLVTYVPPENDFGPDGKQKLLGHAFSRSIGKEAARAAWSQKKAA